MMRRRLVTNVVSKNSTRVAMTAIAGNHLPHRVATSEEHCEHQRDCAPSIGTPRFSCSHRPVAGQIGIDARWWTTHPPLHGFGVAGRGVATGYASPDLCC